MYAGKTAPDADKTSVPDTAVHAPADEKMATADVEPVTSSIVTLPSGVADPISPSKITSPSRSTFDASESVMVFSAPGYGELCPIFSST